MVNLLVLLDTNVLIHVLRGSRQSATDLLDGALPGTLAISTITWMEVLIGVPPDAEASTRLFLDQFDRIEIGREISDKAVQIRRATKLKLPDTIIYATALVSNRTLVTYNTRDFPPGTPSVHTPSS